MIEYFASMLKDDLVEVEALLQKELALDAIEFNQFIRPLSEAGGKRLRARLCLLLAGTKGEVNREERILVATAIEMLHLATLIHDDVLDQSELRRGQVAIHVEHGNKVAILSGDYLFAKSFALVARVNRIEVLTIFTEVIEALVYGEFLQMEDLYNIHQTKERYLEKTQKKTADFIEACLDLGALLADWKQQDRLQLRRFGHALGMIFQITDDMLDFQSLVQTAGKPVEQDLKKGVFTYPLIAVLRKDNEAFLKGEIEKLKAGGEVDTVVAYIKGHEGLALTGKLVEVYGKEAEEALSLLPNFKGKEILHDLMKSLTDRKA